MSDPHPSPLGSLATRVTALRLLLQDATRSLESAATNIAERERSIALMQLIALCDTLAIALERTRLAIALEHANESAQWARG